jgi:hypothetical protein
MKNYILFALVFVVFSCHKVEESQPVLAASLINIADDQIVTLGSKVQIHVELTDYTLDLDYAVQLVYQGEAADNDLLFKSFNHVIKGSYSGNVRNVYAEIDVPKEINGIPVKPGDYKLLVDLKDRKGHQAKLWRDVVLTPQPI